MGILSGAMTVRRFRVLGDVPADFRESYREQLAEHAFHQPPVETGKEEIEGWVNSDNLLDTDFADLNRWLFGEYAMFALRVDKKTLPSKLFQATLAKKCDEWCVDNGRERCPNAVKSTLKEALEEEWLRRALPRVSVTEIAWNLDQGYVLVHSLSDRAADRFRVRFHRTFGLRTAQWSPLDFLQDADLVEGLLAAPPALLHGALHGDQP